MKLLLRCPKTEVSYNVATQFVHSPNEHDEHEGTFVVHKEITEAIHFHSILLQMGTTCCHDVDENLLHSAEQGNHREVLGLLQCPDSDINVKNFKGYTPLHIASKYNHAEVIKVLLMNHLIDTNKGVIIDGSTAFSIASEKSFFQIMGQLVNYMKANVNLGWCDDNWTFGVTKCTTINRHVPTTETTGTTPTGE